MSRLADLIAELEGMSREYGAPPAGELWEKDAPSSAIVDPYGRRAREEPPGEKGKVGDKEKAAGREKEKAAGKDDKAKVREKSPGELKRDRLEKVTDFAETVLKQIGLKTSRVKASTVRAPDTKLDGKPGSAVAMWDDAHTTLLTVFIGDDNMGKAHAMRIEKKEKKLNKDLDFSERGIDRTSREVSSFVRGI
jgi:hypothetical protein